MLPQGSKIGHVNNSRDFSYVDAVIRAKHQNEEMGQLNNIGFTTEPLELQEYFGKEVELRGKIARLNGLWVSGGNTFILRKAKWLR